MERMAGNIAVNGIDPDKIADLFKKLDDKGVLCYSQDIPCLLYTSPSPRDTR